MRKIVAAAVTSLLLTVGGSFIGSSAWAEDSLYNFANGSIFVGGQQVTSLEQGAAFTVRVSHPGGIVDETNDFCGQTVGEGETTGNSLVLVFTSEEIPPFPIPQGFAEDSSLPGVGSFAWKNEAEWSADVTTQLPVDAVPGDYSVYLGCVDSANAQAGPTTNPFPVTILAASNDDPGQADNSTVNPTLAQTGNDETGQYGIAGAAAILLAAGAGTYFLRRRVPTNK